MSKEKVKLIPPDPKQCQHQTPRGAWPDAQHFMETGPRELVRCKSKPIVIITEKKPNAEDGQIGSMSLCKARWEEFLKVYGSDYATTAPV